MGNSFGNMNPQVFLHRMMRNNPNMANNPQAQRIMQIIMNGDSKAGIEMANNYCQSMGLTKEEAMSQLQSFIFQNMGGKR